MSAKFNISDGNGTTNQAIVTSRGQLVTAPLDFSEPIQDDLICVCTAFNFFAPQANKTIELASLIAEFDKNWNSKASNKKKKTASKKETAKAA